jgi:hypothetical protein
LAYARARILSLLKAFVDSSHRPAPVEMSRARSTPDGSARSRAACGLSDELNGLGHGPPILSPMPGFLCIPDDIAGGVLSTSTGYRHTRHSSAPALGRSWSRVPISMTAECTPRSFQGRSLSGASFPSARITTGAPLVPPDGCAHRSRNSHDPGNAARTKMRRRRDVRRACGATCRETEWKTHYQQ